jgi:hypothetical protein
VLLILWCAAVLTQHRTALGGDIEPVLTRTDAVAGLPLVMPVRPVGAGQPRARVTLRFPDGREVAGAVAAVRLSAPSGPAGSWIPAGPSWEVLTPAAAVRARDASSLAWFVLAQPPPGVVGQEIWLDGRPVSLRWLPRPVLLGMRLGFDAGDSDAGVLAHPWSSPLPEGWRGRPDLADALAPARADPLRAWRADLATTGLFPPDEDRAVGLPPDLLDPEIIERIGREAPIADRLLDAVRAQAAARWRVALARLWAADQGVSLRVRQALAGAASFSLGADGEAIAPAWPADDRAAGVLLETLLDEDLPVGERAARAEAWLGEQPDAALWVIDDGRPGDDGLAPTIGALALAAGDAGAILMTRGDTVLRPRVLPTRFLRTLRPPWEALSDRGAVYRVLGENRPLHLLSGSAALKPPGLPTGAFAPDWTMARLLGGGRGPAGSTAPAGPTALITAEGLGASARVRVLLRVPSGVLASGEGWEARVWLGPYSRSRGVLVLRGDGTETVQAMPGRGPLPGRPAVTRGLDGDSVLLDILLPRDASGAGGRCSLGIEVVDGAGSRHAWPRAMLPWQIEPARRVIDPTTWLGELSD